MVVVEGEPLRRVSDKESYFRPVAAPVVGLRLVLPGLPGDRSTLLCAPPEDDATAVVGLEGGHRSEVVFVPSPLVYGDRQQVEVYQAAPSHLDKDAGGQFSMEGSWVEVPLQTVSDPYQAEVGDSVPFRASVSFPFLHLAGRSIAVQVGVVQEAEDGREVLVVAPEQGGQTAGVAVPVRMVAVVGKERERGLGREEAGLDDGIHHDQIDWVVVGRCTAELRPLQEVVVRRDVVCAESALEPPSIRAGSSPSS